MILSHCPGNSGFFPVVIFIFSQEETAKLSQMTGLTKEQTKAWFKRERYERRKTLSEKFPVLVEYFQRNPNPTETEKLQLIEATGLTRTQLNIYFWKERNKFNS